MNANFENLPSLNSYLASSIENIIHHAEDKQTEINNLIQVMRQNEELLTPTTTHPRDLVQYLKLADTMRDLTKEVVGSEHNPTLDNVIRAATARFTHIGTQHTELAIKLIQQLNQVSRETYLQTLAGWIDENKIPLNTLNLSKEEMLELAPHLTYLKISLSASKFMPGGGLGYANEKDNEYGNDFMGQLLENTKIINTLILENFLEIDYKSLSKLANSHHLQQFLIDDSSILLNVHDIRKFLLSIYLEDRDRALKLVHTYNNNPCSLYEAKDISEADLLQDYFEAALLQDDFEVDATLGFKKNHLIGEIRRVIDEMTPEKLGSMLRRNDIPFVKDDILKADRLQQLYIYQLCSDLPSEKIARLKELLTPLVKSPMDQSLRDFYEMLTTFKSEAALERLERVSALMLDREQILRYFPYLFVKTEHPDVIWKNLTNLKKAGQLEQFSALLPPGSHALAIEDLFTENPEDNAMILEFVDYLSRPSVASKSKETIIKNNLMNLARTGLLKGFMVKYKGIVQDTIHFLLLDNFFTETKEDNATKLAFIDRVRPYLEASLYVGTDDQNRILNNLINLNKTGRLVAFMATIKPSEEVAHILSVDNFFNEDGDANLTKLVSMRYLEYASKRDWSQLLKNVETLRMTGQFYLFEEKFPPDQNTASILATEGLFNENSEENSLAIRQLTDLQTEFSNLKNVIPIAEMPWAKEVVNLAQTAVGKAFIKIHLSDIVKVASLQDIVLRTFPPGNPENVKLYPVEDKREGNTFNITVVPTLPVADATKLIKMILANPGINRLNINYYGSPGVDASGLGRQFVSELMQGYVVNRGSLFIRLTEGGMYPYDPSHKKDKDNRAYYHDYNVLGRFLGLALQFEYPTGQVLSEKAINCMLAFTAEDLKEDFDIKKFFDKMNIWDFIRFMKESSNDDEGLVYLYEKGLLSINPDRTLEAAAEINKVIEDDVLSSLIAGDRGNIEDIRKYLRAVWIEDHSFSINALHAMAQGVKQRLPKKIGDKEINTWEDVRTMGTKVFSKHLQGELTPQYVKEHVYVRVVGGVTPEKLATAENVRKWTDEWIDANANDPEKLANFVQAFSGARAMTKDIYLDINPEYHTIVSHTCFYRADLPVGVQEEFVKLMWDEYALGNLKFDVA